MITQETMFALLLLFILFLWFFLRQVSKRWSMWDKHNAQPKPVSMCLHIDFHDGWSMSCNINSPYEAQKYLNRFIWAGVRSAIILVNGHVAYEVDETGLIVYKP